MCTDVNGLKGVWASMAAAVAIAAGVAMQPSTAQADVPHRRPSSNGQGITDEQVVNSMIKGIDFIFNTKNGNSWRWQNPWDAKVSNVGGETGLVLYSLIHAGHSLQDQVDPEDSKRIARLNPKSPELAPVVAFLSKNVPDGTYTAGLQASALALAYNKRRDASAKEGPRIGLELAKKYLIEAIGPEGGYTYTIPPGGFKRGDPAADVTRARAAIDKRIEDAKKKGAEAKAAGNDAEFQKQKAEYEKASEELQKLMDGGVSSFGPIGDISNAQYGALGAWALADAGFEMPNLYWKISDRFWHLTQDASGSWPYTRIAWPYHAGDRDNEVKPTMGVAGLATLFITQDFVDDELRLIPKPDKNIERGLAWLDKDFKPSDNFYYMYGVERVGLASGRKFFGTVDWYREGAANFVKLQQGDGSWGSSFPGADPQNSTAYALLFLSRGRLPIVVNTLE